MKLYFLVALFIVISAQALQAAQAGQESESPQHKDRTTITSQSQSPRSRRSEEGGRARSKSLTHPRVTTPTPAIPSQKETTVAAVFAAFELSRR